MKTEKDFFSFETETKVEIPKKKARATGLERIARKCLNKEELFIIQSYLDGDSREKIAKVLKMPEAKTGDIYNNAIKKIKAHKSFSAYKKRTIPRPKLKLVKGRD